METAIQILSSAKDKAQRAAEMALTIAYIRYLETKTQEVFIKIEQLKDVRQQQRRVLMKENKNFKQRPKGRKYRMN